MNCRKKPCAQCPWRRDVDPGQFPADRYEELAATTGSPGHEADFDAPLFGCHKSTEAEPMPCAGWLAAVGYDSIRVRLLLAQRAIPIEAMEPGGDWPPLFGSYEEMVTAQAGARGGRSVCLNERCRDFAVVQTVSPGHRCPGCGGEMRDPQLREGGDATKA